MKKRFKKIFNVFKKMILPGFGGVPIFNVIKFFYKKLLNESISMRASAVAYSLFLAMFPGLIFLFTLIPYIPLPDLKLEMFHIFKEMLPSAAFATIESTLSDILLTRHGGLLSFGVIMTVYFATNGIDKLIQTFNHNIRVKFIRRYPVSLMLTFLLSFLTIISLAILIGGSYVLEYLRLISFFKAIWIYNIISLFKFVISILLLICTVSMLYYFGTVKMHKFSFFSPGALLSSICIAISSIGFRYYVENFGNYNTLYGSLGALICLMIYLYLNSSILIAGYEFNKSIISAQKQQGVE